MQKYDVQQLLRQQKDSIYQSIITIILAVILSICTSIIYTKYAASLSTKGSILLASVVIIVLIMLPICLVLKRKNDYFAVKKEKITLLLAFDKERDSIKSIQFNDYPFSVYCTNDWNRTIAKDTENLKAFIKAHNETHYLSVNSKEKLDRKIIADLVFYHIIRKMSSNRHLLLNRDETQWIITQPNAIKKNYFVKAIHSQQIDYEEKMKNGETIDGAIIYIPFCVTFPEGINYELTESINSPICKIILTSKYGRLTIEFDDLYNPSLQKTFAYTVMKPGNRHRHYEEICLDMSVNLDIKKYAYFPLVGGPEESVDEFMSWANQTIDNLRTFCDWDYFEKNIKRELFQELFNKLDGIQHEINIEHYDNFEDNKFGRTQRLLRYMINPHFEYRRDALREMIKAKDELPTDLVETSILRILRLTYFKEEVTRFQAAEALGELKEKIPVNLHQEVVDALLKLVDDEDDAVKRKSVESLCNIFPYVDSRLKTKIQSKIINDYVENAQFYFERETPLRKIYPHISDGDKGKFETTYLHKLLEKKDTLSIIQALRFYRGIRDFITPEQTRQVMEYSLNIDLTNNEIIGEYLILLAFLSKKIPNYLIDLYYDKVYFLLTDGETNVKILVINILISSSLFIERLDMTQRESIFLILKEYTKCEDSNLKSISLKGLANIAEYLSGKEDQIAEILLNEIENVGIEELNNDLTYYMVHCFEKIYKRVRDDSILTKIDKFQQSWEAFSH